LPIFRMKVREMEKLPYHFPAVIDYHTFGTDYILSVSQAPMGVALGCQGLGRPEEVSFGRAGIGGGATFCREKIAYRVRLGELGPRQSSRTRRRSHFVHKLLISSSQLVQTNSRIKREGASALSHSSTLKISSVEKSDSVLL
jgi:hypothetical protein